MNQNARNQMIEEYGRGFDFLNAALAEIPPEAWEFKPAPSEWSVHELIIHMADSEAIGAMRVRKLIAEPGGTIMAYEDDIWAKALNYQNQSTDDALQLFRLTRQTTYHLLKALPEQVYLHTVVLPEAVHPEYGAAYTLEKWLNIYTGHVSDHIEQLQKTHRAWKERDK